jgi:anti-sigma factor RsiW
MEEAMDCFEAIDLMGDAVEGRLVAARRPGFDEHMAECIPCATYFEHLRITREALQHLPPEGGTNPNLDSLLRAYRKEFGEKR